MTTPSANINLNKSTKAGSSASVRGIGRNKQRADMETSNNVPSGKSRQILKKPAAEFDRVLKEFVAVTDHSWEKRGECADVFADCMNDKQDLPVAKQEEFQAKARQQLLEIEKLLNAETEKIDKILETVRELVKNKGADFSTGLDRQGKLIPHNRRGQVQPITAGELLALAIERRPLAAQGACLAGALVHHANGLRTYHIGTNIQYVAGGMVKKKQHDPHLWQQDLEQAKNELEAAKTALEDEKTRVAKAKAVKPKKQSNEQKIIVRMADALIERKQVVVEKKQEAVRRFTYTIDDALEWYKKSAEAFARYLKIVDDFKAPDKLDVLVEVNNTHAGSLIGGALLRQLRQGLQLQEPYLDDAYETSVPGVSAHEDWFEDEFEDMREEEIDARQNDAVTSIDAWYKSNKAACDFLTQQATYADELIDVATDMIANLEKKLPLLQVQAEQGDQSAAENLRCVVDDIAMLREGLDEARDIYPQHRNESGHKHADAIEAMTKKLDVQACRIEAARSGLLAPHLRHTVATCNLLQNLCKACYWDEDKDNPAPDSEKEHDPIPDGLRFAVMRNLASDYAGIADHLKWLVKKFTQTLPSGEQSKQFLDSLNSLQKECSDMVTRLSHDAKKLAPEFFDEKKLGKLAAQWSEQYNKDLAATDTFTAHALQKMEVAVEAMDAHKQEAAQKEKEKKKASQQKQNAQKSEPPDNSAAEAKKRLEDAVMQVNRLKDEAFGPVVDEKTKQRTGGTFDAHADTVTKEMAAAEELAVDPKNGYMVESRYMKAAKKTDEQAAIKEHLATRTDAAAERMAKLDDERLATWRADAITLREEAKRLRDAAKTLRAMGEREHDRLDMNADPTEDRFKRLEQRGLVDRITCDEYDRSTGIIGRRNYNPKGEDGKVEQDRWTKKDKVKHFERYEVWLKDGNGIRFLWGVPHIHFPNKDATEPSPGGQHFKRPGQEHMGNHNERGEWIDRFPIVDQTILPTLRRYVRG